MKQNQKCCSYARGCRREKSDRRMLKMLGVLAIVSVLTVSLVGIAGYTTAVNKRSANQILNEASVRAMVVSRQIQKGAATPTLDEFTDKTVGGATFGNSVKNTAGTEDWVKGTDYRFSLTLTGVDEGVCQQMKAMAGENGLIRAIADDCTALTYNNDLSTTNILPCNNGPCQTCSIDAKGNKTHAFVASGTACVQAGLNGACNALGQCIPSEGISCSSASECPEGYFCNYGGTFGNYGGGYTPDKCEKVNPMTVEISGVTYYYNSETDLKSWCRPADREYNCTWGYLARQGAESWCQSLGKNLLTQDEFNSVLPELKAVLPRGATMLSYWAQGGSFYGEDFTWSDWTGRPDGYANAGGVVCR